MPFISNGIHKRTARAKANSICHDFILNTKSVLRNGFGTLGFEFWSSGGNADHQFDPPEVQGPGASSPLQALEQAPLEASLETIFLGRSSEREFTATAVPLDALGAMLRAAFGAQEDDPWINEPYRAGMFLEASQSNVSRINPITIYAMVIGPVSGLKRGLYRYWFETSSLEPMQLPKSFEVSEIIKFVEEIENPKVIFLMVGNFARISLRHGPPGYRLTLIEVGHVQAHMALAAEALELGWVNCGSGFDREIEDLLGIDGVDRALVGVSVLG